MSFNYLINKMAYNKLARKSSYFLLQALRGISSASVEGGRLVVSWDKSSAVSSTVSRYDGTWLRYNCLCSQCLSSSGQKMRPSYSLQPPYTVSEVGIKGKELTVRWKEDLGHVGIFPLKMLKENSYDPPLDTRSRQPPPLKEPVTEISYPEMLNDDKLVLKWLQLLAEQGLVLLKNVPTDDGTVEKVLNLIAPIQKTIYGGVADVKSAPEPINVAYSNVFLEPHVDIPYMKSPPGLQFFHCLKFDSCVEGGESFFVDSFHAAEEFRKAHPQDFATLTTIPATFQKVHYERGRPVHMVYRKPHIELNEEGEIIAVTWSPIVEGYLQTTPDKESMYYPAHYSFAQWINTFDKVIIRLQPGDTIVFNNLRILHGRNGFRLNDGMRHFQSAYVNIDEFKSEYIYKSITQTGEMPISYHVGNQNH